MVRVKVFCNYHANTMDYMDVFFSGLPMGWGATQHHVNLALLRILEIEP